MSKEDTAVLATSIIIEHFLGEGNPLSPMEEFELELRINDLISEYEENNDEP